MGVHRPHHSIRSIEACRWSISQSRWWIHSWRLHPNRATPTPLDPYSPLVRVPAATITLSIGILFGSLSACVETRVTKWNPMLGGLPGATSGMPVTTENRFNFPSPTVAPERGIRQENDAGEVTLHARSARHLMSHIYTTLQQDERDLFAEQVLSSITRAEFLARGRDPAEAFDMLKARQNDVFKLFDIMPAGEYTPGVIWNKLGQIDGKNLVRIGVSGLAARGLQYTYFDMVMERGSWRLRWFGR